MSAGSHKFTVRRIAALSLVSLWLAGCSNTSNPPAPVSSVDGGASANTNSGMLITPPPKWARRRQYSKRRRSSRCSVRPHSQHRSSLLRNNLCRWKTVVLCTTVSMGTFRKVAIRAAVPILLRKAIPFFYIARITGNDFRDLAQRNNVPAPYGLNVGQTLQVGNASGAPITGGNAITRADAAQQGVVTNPAQNSTVAVASKPTITYSEDSGEQSANKMLPNNKPAGTVVTAPVTAPAVSATESTASSTSTSSPISTALADRRQSDRKLCGYRRWQ